MNNNNQTERVSDEELDHMILKLERDGGMTPKMLSLMKELREVRRAKGEPAAIVHHDEKGFHALLCRELPDGVPLYTAPPAPVVPCPFPCGWDNLNRLAIQDSAFVERGLVEGEIITEAHRQAAVSNNYRLLKVISFCRDAMLAAAPKEVG